MATGESPGGITRYADLMKDLSLINRKLMRQGYQVVVGSVTVNDDSATPRTVDVSLKTAGNSWVVNNAWTKGQALWTQMNKEVLDDNPSIRGTWQDFKTRLVESHVTANTLTLRDGQGATWPTGSEWAMSTYVVPQHDVDAAGVVLPAEQWTSCLVGPSDLGNNIVSLTQAYEESRATVQDASPNVSPLVPTSFYLQLTDDGSQDPELATVIAGDNDVPPYPNGDGEYPGGASFTASKGLVTQQRGIMNAGVPTLVMGGFVAQCGLVEINATSDVGTDNIELIFNLVPGRYKGLMAQPMGQ